MTSFVLGIDVGGTTISAGIVDQHGNVVNRFAIPSRTEAPKQNLPERIIELARKATDKTNIIAVGIGVPGAVDFARGRVTQVVFNLPELRNVSLRSILERSLRLPVMLDNDVNALALAEHRWGVAKGKRDFVLITLGTGVGGAIVLDGKLRRGAHGHAGEIGHATVKFDGRKCFCGSVGCLKAYAAGPDLVQQFGDVSLSPRELVLRARKGNRRAIKVIQTAAQALGATCANVMNTIDPEMIVIGGSVVLAGDLLLKPARTWARKYALPGLAQKVPIVRSRFRKANAFLGAAALAWESLAVE